MQEVMLMAISQRWNLSAIAYFADFVFTLLRSR